MAISTDFIVGLIFNLLSIIASLITMWQTQKILALKQSRKFAPRQTKLVAIKA